VGFRNVLVRQGRETRVLVAEDEALVSMLLEEVLADEGYSAMGPFRSCAEAMASLKADPPDMAVLDYELADGPCTDLALELRRRGVPFLLLSGLYPDDIPEAFRDVPMIVKPSSLDSLGQALATLWAAKSSALVPSLEHGVT
jgi:DNA-binding response OmpR family regulator